MPPGPGKSVRHRQAGFSRQRNGIECPPALPIPKGNQFINIANNLCVTNGPGLTAVALPVWLKHKCFHLQGVWIPGLRLWSAIAD
jgi:hypothetical protein